VSDQPVFNESKLFKSRLNHLLIAFLSCCLLLVIIFYLSSEYAAEPHIPTVPESVTSSSASQTVTSQNSNNIIEKPIQPDASLPLPAHQLKKLIVESNSLPAVEAREALDQKIQAINQSIANVDEQVGQNSGAQKLTSQAKVQQPNSKIQQRIDHLQQYLQQQSQK
jgi:hypothetical protein